MGGRRVWIRESDLSALAERVEWERDGPTTDAGPEEGPLTFEEQAELGRAIEAAKALQAELLRQRGGRPFPPSEEVLAEIRNARSSLYP
jgi:hypothetical protein